MASTTLYCEDGTQRDLPFKWAICMACEGHGTSSAYLGAFTGDQMREDPDFAAAYLDGAYDKTCEACNGLGKIKVIDVSRTAPADLREMREQERDDAEIDAIHRAEMRAERGFEAGY